MNVSQFSYLFAFILFISCGFESQLIEESNTNENSQNQYIDVDARLIPFFVDFEEEAQIRGYSIDLTDLGITGVIETIQEEGVAGTCQYGQHIHHVTVDQNFWNNSSNTYKEFVVFHELGHCVLMRGHTEDAFANGICKSIMRSGLGDCRDAYINQNRTYYIDELFGEDNTVQNTNDNIFL